MNRLMIPRQKAFTLIELLVVISIIALLVSILMPALSKARQSARGILCLSNQRQMAMASYNYASSNNDFYPIAYYYEIPVATGPMVSYGWDFISSKDWSTTPPTEEIRAGLLWSYSDNMEIQQCPSFKGEANWLDDPFTGYNYNTSYIGGGAGENNSQPAKISSVGSPSETALFGDGQFSGGANKFMRSPLDDNSNQQRDKGCNFRSAGTQGYRHNGKTNVAFCDGHAQSWGDRFTGGHDNVAEGTGFLSDNNRLYDLK